MRVAFGLRFRPTIRRQTETKHSKSAALPRTTDAIAFGSNLSIDGGGVGGGGGTAGGGGGDGGGGEVGGECGGGVGSGGIGGGDGFAGCVVGGGGEGGGDVSHQLVNFNAMFGGLVILEVRLNWVISKRKKRKTFGL